MKRSALAALWWAVLGGLATIWLAGCAPEPAEEKPVGPIKRTMSATTVHMAWQEPGPDGRVQPVLELEARAGKLEEDRKSGSFEGALARVYRNGKLVATVYAPHVDAQMEGKLVKGWGGIRMEGESPPGLEVWSQRLEWYFDQQKIVALGNVRFRQRTSNGGIVAEGGVFPRVTMYTARQRITIP